MLGPLAPGQLGPLASASSVFSPLSLSPLLWYDAGKSLFQNSDGTSPAVSNGDPVGYWGDQSGGGFNATQATSGKRGSLVTSWSNGRPAVRFTKANSQVLVGGAYGTKTSPFTLYIAFSWVTVGVTQSIFGGVLINGNVNDVAASILSSNKYEFYNGTVLDSGAAVATTANVVLAVVFNGVSSGAWLNNSNIASGNAGTGSQSQSEIGSTSGVNPSDANVGEVILYNALHTTAQRTVVQAYLATKYGITLV